MLLDYIFFYLKIHILFISKEYFFIKLSLISFFYFFENNFKNEIFIKNLL